MNEIKYTDSAIKLAGIKLPIRSSLIPTSHGNILYSPCPKLEREKLREYQNVKFIIAPSGFHYLGVKRAKEVHQTAEVWGTPGSGAKLKGVSLDKVFGEDAWPAGDEVDFTIVGGMPKVQEVVLLHRSSRTLICSDLCFNLENNRSFGDFLMFKLFGTYGKFAVSRLFTCMVKDKEAFKNSIRHILQWEFDSIAMGHGEIVSGEAKERLREAVLRRVNI